MERLTKRTYTISEPHVEMVTAVPGINVTNILDRLAAYEDTGLEPEEISSLNYLRRIEEEAKLAAMCGYGINPERLHDIVEAEKEGRLLVLPCKVGDTVWSAKPFVDGKIRAGNIVEISVDSLGFCGFWASFCSEAIAAEFIKDDFGKIVFRTREEAEAALKEREGK